MHVFAYTHTFILYISLFIGIIAVVKAIKKGVAKIAYTF